MSHILSYRYRMASQRSKIAYIGAIWWDLTSIACGIFRVTSTNTIHLWLRQISLKLSLEYFQP